ncbi:DUF2510 domain-containing protein [Streptomyces sp. NBC_00654]|uniref:DUF2510 domain-containing protein n=1 Tax=Streptomyces sp. NBC_00654 TaxID=2975799 RepID=UPI00225B7C6B|nr:DUF2510 domain-containing protein [Streptomyces sp. NBC_00654]MCX4966124.1 DUF2510 domain-containing protein [Streptomyces sp. NBC_00654]
MSPPGWHPDPGHSGIGPAQERWWDGTRWTEHLRVPPAAIRRRRTRVAVGATVGVVVLAAIGGGVFLLQEDGDNRPDTAATAPQPAPSGSPGRPGAPDGNGGDGGGNGNGGQGPDGQIPPTEKGYATDLASGISLPVPKGWTGRSGTVGAGLTTGEYACPGNSGEKCVRGGVFSAPAVALKLDATTAEAAAKKDIAVNAEESYGEKIYGGITSHEQLKSEPVTVAGQKGYAVRWKVVTEKGDDGYVESLAFPSPASKDMLIVVRSGFDVNAGAPELSVLDDITKGIKAAAGGAGTGRTA